MDEQTKIELRKISLETAKWNFRNNCSEVPVDELINQAQKLYKWLISEGYVSKIPFIDEVLR